MVGYKIVVIKTILMIFKHLIFNVVEI